MSLASIEAFAPAAVSDFSDESELSDNHARKLESLLSGLEGNNVLSQLLFMLGELVATLAKADNSGNCYKLLANKTDQAKRARSALITALKDNVVILVDVFSFCFVVDLNFY